MSEEDSFEYKKNSFEKANIIISYIFSFFNICFIIISSYILKSIKKGPKLLKYKLLSLLITETISLILYANLKYNYDTFLIDFLFSLFTTTEFYLLLSFFYQIVNTTEISKSSKSVHLVNPFLLTFIFFLIIFPYYRIFTLYSKTFKFLQYIVLLRSLLFLYRYFNNTIQLIIKYLVSKDIESKKVFYYLKYTNMIILGFLVVYYLIKIIAIYITHEIYILYIELILNTINKINKNNSLNKFIFFNYIIILLKIY